jgi:hypothetical protein
MKLEAVIWALFAFESLTDIMINYVKTELVPINLEEEEGQYYAVMIRCKFFKFSIKYLDLSLHDRKLRPCDWDLVFDKV